MTREQKKYGVHHLVKIGTMPLEAVWLRIPEGGFDKGKRTVFRRSLDEVWQETVIWKVGSPPEYCVFLEL